MKGAENANKVYLTLWRAKHFITNTGIVQFVYYYTETNCFTKTKWYNITCMYSVVNIPSQIVHKVFTIVTHTALKTKLRLILYRH